MRFFELLDQSVAVDIVGRIAVPGGRRTQRRGQMHLAHARRTEEHNVLPVFQKPPGRQLVNLPFVDGGLEAEVEVLIASFDRKPGLCTCFSYARRRLDAATKSAERRLRANLARAGFGAGPNKHNFSRFGRRANRKKFAAVATAALLAG